MRTAAKILLLAGLTAWVYGPCLGGGWLWDDGLEVVQNAALRSPGGWWEPWVHPAGMDYFPLKASLQWVEWRLWGGAPLGYHLVNLGLHVASALLLWRLLRALAIPGAYLAALLFAVHPLAVESVAWIAEFKNTASLPFLLLAALAYERFDRTGSRGAYAGALAAFAASLACKTSVVMFPFVLCLYAWWRRGRVGARDVRPALPFFAAALAAGLATVHFQSARAIGAGGAMPAGPARLAAAGWSLLAYARQAAWPSGLAPIYPAEGAGPAALVPWALVAAAVGVCLARRRSWGRPALLGIGWFLLNLVPILGILPMSYLRIAPRADHFAYVSLVGAVGLIAAAGAAAVAAWSRRAAQRAGAPVAGWAVGAAAVAALALTAHAYAGVFHDQAALWSAAVARNPSSWLAHNNLGQVRQQAGDLAAALDQYSAAARLQPDSAEAQANLGTVLDSLRRGEEARRHYREALRLDPAFAGAHYDLGLSLFGDRQVAAAAQAFRAALQLNPQHANAHNMLGLALTLQGEPAAGRAEYEAALRIDPQNRAARLNLGNADFRAGRYGEAVGQWRRIPDPPPGLRHNIAQALRLLGRGAEADAEERAAGAEAP